MGHLPRISPRSPISPAHDLAVAHSSSARRSVWLSGTVAQMSNAFGVQLAEYGHPDGGSYRGRTGPIMIPEDLDGIVVGVFGLENRPQAKPHFRTRGPHLASLAQEAAATGLSRFTPPQIARLYDFPANLDGTGQCIAIIELGGGFNTSDLTTYFSSLGIKPQPSVTSVSIDNGQISHRQRRWARRRGDARHRSRRGHRAESQDRRLFRAEYHRKGFSTPSPTPSTIPSTNRRSSRSVGAAPSRPGPPRPCSSSTRRSRPRPRLASP